LSGDVTHLAATLCRLILYTLVKIPGHCTPLRFVSPYRCCPGKPCHPHLHRLSSAPITTSLVLLPHAGHRAPSCSAFGLSSKRHGESRCLLVGKLQRRHLRASTSSTAPSHRALHRRATMPSCRRHLSMLATAAHHFLLPLRAGPATPSLEARPERQHSPVVRPTRVAPLSSFFRPSLKPRHLPVSCHYPLHPR
jgi:hypothetical protein